MLVGAHRSRTRAARPLTGVLFALAVGAGGEARADTGPVAVVPAGSGLTGPAGLARDVRGALWASDADLGVCRLDPTRPGGAPVPDRWCAAVHEGPKAAFQLAYDGASDTLFAAEGTSASSGVWRMRLDPVSGAISSAEKLVDTTLTDERVFGLALGSAAGTPVLDFAAKRTSLVRRLLNPTTCAAPCPAVPIGSALSDGVPSLARLGEQLYLAEPTGVTRIVASGAGQVAQPVAGLPGGVPSAVAADPDRGRVYAGTRNPNGRDQVDALAVGSGRVETYAASFSGVGAMAVGADGTLFVADDTAGDGDGVAGAGRVFSVALTPLDRPRAIITESPATWTNSRSGRFEFGSPSAAGYECRLDPAGDASPWAGCGTGASGTFAVDALTDGVHTFQVRGVSGEGTRGPSASRTFVVDLQPPALTVDEPADDASVLEGDPVRVRFSASEPMAAVACSLDSGPARPCSDPVALEGLALGAHRFAITGVDIAGNPSPPAILSFTVRSVPPVPADPPPASGAPAADAGTPATSGSGRERRDPAFEPFRPSASPAWAAGTPDLRPRGLWPFSHHRRTLRTVRRFRMLHFAVGAPWAARFAVLQITPYPETARSPVAFTIIPVRGPTAMRWRLKPYEARRMHYGLYRVKLTLIAGPHAGPPIRGFLRLTRPRR